MTSTGSRRASATPSKSRSPEPSRTGTKSRTSSSTPPAAPVALPRTANRPEHLASHHVRAARAQQQVACAGVGVVQRLVEMPVMQLDTATAETVLEALVRSCDKTVERNRHMTG